VSGSSGFVKFLYGNSFGRAILKVIMKLRLDRIAVRFLRSSCSKIIIKNYARKNGIALTDQERKAFGSFRDFFARTRIGSPVDREPSHLISPCDGWLSAFKISADSAFEIKGSHYFVRDFLEDATLAKKYENGDILIFRLCANDYHHYSYIDGGMQGKNHYIEGELHSVQPIVCENVPIYVRNRRSWCLLETDNFGSVVECEIGALVVGGIVNHKECGRFEKGSEKGHFDLSGSTIVLLFEPGKIKLNDSITSAFAYFEEQRVCEGEWIGTANI
jgi:phosphatidylserine decarboxylase